MKKIFFAVGMAFFLSFNLNAQSKYLEATQEVWYNEGLEDSGIYGVNTEKAYQFLKEKNRKPVELVVAVLDGGVQADHVDLAANMWVNPKEIAGNGKDDDGNGYIDDIHGWNFMGNASGENVDFDTLEMTRFMKYELIPLFESGDAELNNENKTKFPDKYKEYQEIKARIAKERGEASGMMAQMKYLEDGVETGFPVLIKDFGDTPVTEENFGNYKPSSEDANAALMLFAFTPKESWIGKTMPELYEGFKKIFKEANEYYNAQLDFHLNLDYESRGIVGDNYDDKSEKIYGNNDIEGPDAKHGTHVAGLIAAVRGNGKGIDGIGGNTIRIMGVRTVPNGDERDKDVANAIRYAADNGAKIMNMSFGKDFSPEKELVWDALRYASDKGILLVQAAGNDDENTDIKTFYPSNMDDEGKTIAETLITVGASTKDPDILKASFSNYGKVTVDVFSPGAGILSTVPHDEFEETDGTSMASPITAGVAALVWSHYPKLTALEVKSIILGSVNKNPQLTDLCVTGGVVDAYNAVKLAEEMYKNKK